MGLLEKGLAMENALIKNLGGTPGKLKTDIDRLYYIIKSQGNMSLKEACKNLGIDKMQAEEYARILFEQNLIVIKRPLIGDIMLLSAEKKSVHVGGLR